HASADVAYAGGEQPSYDLVRRGAEGHAVGGFVELTPSRRPASTSASFTGGRGTGLANLYGFSPLPTEGLGRRGPADCLESSSGSTLMRVASGAFHRLPRRLPRRLRPGFPNARPLPCAGS